MKHNEDITPEKMKSALNNYVSKHKSHKH
jgi:hypothetical protein